MTQYGDYMIKPFIKTKDLTDEDMEKIGRMIDEEDEARKRNVLSKEDHEKIKESFSLISCGTHSNHSSNFR